MTERELIDRLLAFLPNMTLGEDNSGQLVVYTDRKIVGGELVPFDGPDGFGG